MAKSDRLIPPDHILLDSRAGSKRALITELASVLPAMDPDPVLEVVMAREQLGSTGIGNGVAIPHGRLPDLSEPVLALARHKAGIDFDAIDGNPVHIAILLLVPQEAERGHLELLAHLARTLQQEHVRREIMEAETADQISRIFAAMPRSAAA
jgi:mannitol/fructose-specific phosphotransferase system IIA component (Ntr-type)